MLSSIAIGCITKEIPYLYVSEVNSFIHVEREFIVLWNIDNCNVTT